MFSNSFERLETLKQYFSKEQLFDMMMLWVDDDTLNEFIDQVIIDNDLDYFDNEDEL